MATPSCKGGGSAGFVPGSHVPSDRRRLCNERSAGSRQQGRQLAICATVTALMSHSLVRLKDTVMNPLSRNNVMLFIDHSTTVKGGTRPFALYIPVLFDLCSGLRNTHGHPRVTGEETDSDMHRCQTD